MTGFDVFCVQCQEPSRALKMERVGAKRIVVIRSETVVWDSVGVGDRIWPRNTS